MTLQIAALLLLLGCGDDGNAPIDGSLDAGVDAGFAIAAPAAPVMEPCAEGWALVEGACEPFAEGDSSCAPGEARFPGDAACAAVGDPCPTSGDFAEGLPAAGDVRFVRAGAPTGGDGTRDAPFATIEDAMRVAGTGTIVALAAGTYDEPVSIVRGGVTLFGACAASTRIETATPSLVRDGVVTVSAPDVILRNVSIGGAREGLVVRGPDGAVEVRGVIIDGAVASGVSVFPDAALSGSGLVVRDTAAADRTWGYGIAVAPRAVVTLDRVRIERAISSAVAVLEAEVTLARVVLADAQPQPRDGRLGLGLEASGGARVTLREAVIEGAYDRAMMVSETGTEVVLERAVVRGTRARVSDGGGGNGAFVFGTASLVLRQTLLERNREAALLVTDLGTRVTLEDVVIRRTEGRASDGVGGTALALQAEASAVISRAVFSENRAVSVYASGGSTLAMTDTVIADTHGDGLDDRFGHGLQAQEGGRIEGERVRVEGSRGGGVVAIGSGSHVRLADLEVAETLERECAATTCPGLGFGDGVLSTVSASIEIERFVVRGSARAGVHVANGTMDLIHGRIVENAIGAAIQTPGFDVMRISNDVVFLDNDRNVDTATLPVPEPSVGY